MLVCTCHDGMYGRGTVPLILNLCTKWVLHNLQIPGKYPATCSQPLSSQHKCRFTHGGASCLEVYCTKTVFILARPGILLFVTKSIWAVMKCGLDS